MAKLIPFKPSMLKQMGIVNTKKGPMIDSSKVTVERKEKKQEPKKPVQEVKKPVREEKYKKVSSEEKERLSNRGIY